jgi:hypothetical protein
VDRAPRRRVVLGRGELESGVAAAQREDALDRSLAERRLAHHQCAIQILQRARHDLGGRRGRRIDQHHHRPVELRTALGGVVAVVLALAPAARVDHQRVGLHQLLDDVHRLIQQAAWIRTQIQHQAVRARDP